MNSWGQFVNYCPTKTHLVSAFSFLSFQSYVSTFEITGWLNDTIVNVFFTVLRQRVSTDGAASMLSNIDSG